MVMELPTSKLVGSDKIVKIGIRWQPFGVFLYVVFFGTFFSKLTGERRWRKKSTAYMTSTGNLISLEKFKLVNQTSPAQPNFPREIWSGSQAKESTIPRAIWPREPRSNCPRDCAPWRLTTRPNNSWAVLVALAESHLLAWISRGKFDFWYKVYTQSTGSSPWGKDLSVVDFFPSEP